MGQGGKGEVRQCERAHGGNEGNAMGRPRSGELHSLFSLRRFALPWLAFAVQATLRLAPGKGPGATLGGYTPGLVGRQGKCAIAECGR